MLYLNYMDGELKWFLLLLLCLWFAWIATGGPDRIPENKANPFLKQPEPIDNGKIYSLQDLQNKK